MKREYIVKQFSFSEVKKLNKESEWYENKIKVIESWVNDICNKNNCRLITVHQGTYYFEKEIK